MTWKVRIVFTNEDKILSFEHGKGYSAKKLNEFPHKQWSHSAADCKEINSDELSRSHDDLYLGVNFFETKGMCK